MYKSYQKKKNIQNVIIQLYLTQGDTYGASAEENTYILPNCQLDPISQTCLPRHQIKYMYFITYNFNI